MYLVCQSSIHCHNDSDSAWGKWSPVLNRTVPAVDPGCDAFGDPGADVALHQFAGTPFGAINRSEYSFMVLQVNHGRGMLLADPSKPVRPWFADKSFCAAVRPSPGSVPIQLCLILNGQFGATGAA